MLRKVVKWSAIGVAVVLVLAGGLYALGLRVVLYGGGKPRLQFVESERTRTERIAKDRASHQNAPPLAAVPVDTAPPAAPVTMGSAPAPAPTDALPVASSAESPYWTDFRGPHRDGHYRERPILTLWPGDGLKPLWKQPVGGGYASFVIARGRAFTIEQRDTQEVVAAYDVATGRQLWISAWTARFHESMGGDGPRATPTWADGRVYALGAMGREGATPVKLALAGAAVTAGLTSVTSAIVLTNIDALNELRAWEVGSLAGRYAPVLQQTAPFMAAAGIVALGG